MRGISGGWYFTKSAQAMVPCSYCGESRTRVKLINHIHYDHPEVWSMHIGKGVGLSNRIRHMAHRAGAHNRQTARTHGS